MCLKTATETLLADVQGRLVLPQVDFRADQNERGFRAVVLDFRKPFRLDVIETFAACD